MLEKLKDKIKKPNVAINLLGVVILLFFALMFFSKLNHYLDTGVEKTEAAMNELESYGFIEELVRTEGLSEYKRKRELFESILEMENVIKEEEQILVDLFKVYPSSTLRDTENYIFGNMPKEQWMKLHTRIANYEIVKANDSERVNIAKRYCSKNEGVAKKAPVVAILTKEDFAHIGEKAVVVNCMATFQEFYYNLDNNNF